MALIVWSGWESMWASITSGDIATAALAPFVYYLGVWFYLLIGFAAMTMLYMKWNDFNSTVLVGMIILGGMLPFASAMLGFNAAIPIIYAICALGIAAILYKTVYKGG